MVALVLLSLATLASIHHANVLTAEARRCAQRVQPRRAALED